MILRSPTENEMEEPLRSPDGAKRNPGSFIHARRCLCHTPRHLPGFRFAPSRLQYCWLQFTPLGIGKRIRSRHEGASSAWDCSKRSNRSIGSSCSTNPFRSDDLNDLNGLNDLNELRTAFFVPFVLEPFAPLRHEIFAHRKTNGRVRPRKLLSLFRNSR